MQQRRKNTNLQRSFRGKISFVLDHPSSVESPSTELFPASVNRISIGDAVEACNDLDILRVPVGLSVRNLMA